MTDLEIIELAIRRTSAKLKNGCDVPIPVCCALDELADELARVRSKNLTETFEI